MMTLLLKLLFILATINSSGPRIEELRNPVEKHLQNVRQLTFGGTNAEAYFSFDQMKLTFQSTRAPYQCDQIFSMNIDGSAQTLLSTGKGTTTCAFFFPDGKGILYASTHGERNECYPRPDKSKGYVWGVWNAYDIYRVDVDGTGLKILLASKGYDAEATISPTADKIVFTSSREGDLDLYTSNLDGSGIRRITKDLGYDGGAFFSWDGKRIVYRAYHPSDSTEIAEYKSFLGDQLVKPGKMEIFISDAEGSNRRQLTRSGTANFAPFFHPDNKRIIFSSNALNPRGRNFHLFIMNDDGTKMEQVTSGDGFNSFPMFTRDGKKIIFVSDRNAKGPYEFNVFIADWVE